MTCVGVAMQIISEAWPEYVYGGRGMLQERWRAPWGRRSPTCTGTRGSDTWVSTGNRHRALTLSADTGNRALTLSTDPGNWVLTPGTGR